MRHVDEQTTDIVMYFMHLGMAPSEIDKMMVYEHGTAHDAVVRHWASETDEEQWTANCPRQ